MPVPSIFVYPDPDIDALRADAGTKLTGRSRDTALDLVTKYDQGRDFSEKQWALVALLVQQMTAPAPTTRSDNADIETLRAHGALSFNASAAADFVARYDAGRPFSDAQWSFVAKPAKAAREKAAPAPAAKSAPTAQLPAICELLDRAAKTLQWPSVRLGDLRAYRRKDGSVGIKANGQQLASVQRDGAVWVHPRADQATVNGIQALVFDPVTAASVNGRARVNCCFCGRTLDNYASKTAGYGPDCAGNYNLPWGDVDLSIAAPTFQASELMD